MTVEEKIQRYCAYQERCTRDVEIKLRDWKTPPGKIKKIIQQLVAEGFLNNERFSRSFVRGKFLNNHWGRIRISYELKSRGMPDKLISEAFNEIDENGYMKTLRNLILKKRKDFQTGKNLNIREKLINFALSKGYEFDLIAAVLKEMKI